MTTKIPNHNLEGITLIAMRDGKPVNHQAVIVAAFLRPAISAVLKATQADREEDATGRPNGKDHARQVLDLEIECATLRHGLRLADRRYEETVAAMTASGPATTRRQKDSGILVLDAVRNEAGAVESLIVIDAETEGQPMVQFVTPGSETTGETVAADTGAASELRTAVRAMVRMLEDREWAEHISADPDAVALEAAITVLMGEASAAHDGSTVAEAGMPAHQEPKYGIRGGHLFNRSSGLNIPHDEPIFVLRARDRKAAAALHFYAGICDNPEHVAAVQQRILDFTAFAKRKPAQMKQPDTDLSVLDGSNRLGKLDK